MTDKMTVMLRVLCRKEIGPAWLQKGYVIASASDQRVDLRKNLDEIEIQGKPLGNKNKKNHGALVEQTLKPDYKIEKNVS